MKKWKGTKLTMKIGEKHQLQIVERIKMGVKEEKCKWEMNLQRLKYYEKINRK